MTDPLETPEGQRIVEAAAHALCTNHGHRTRNNDPFCLESKGEAIVALRAALSVTGECKTCAGKGWLDDYQRDGCPTCGGGAYRAGSGRAGEPLLVLREQLVPKMVTVGGVESPMTIMGETMYRWVRKENDA